MLGSGTIFDPFIIENVVDLQNVNLDLGAYYELRSDIDATITSTWNAGQGFLPIGDNVTPFTGHFNGNSHIISNLYFDWSSLLPPAVNHGLFGTIQSPAELDSIVLTGVRIPVGGSWSGLTATGGLVGHMISGNIFNCHSAGVVHSDRLPGLGLYAPVGGLVGVVESGSLEKCSSSGSVSGLGHAGGLVGRVITGMVNNLCFSVADVISQVQHAGGLVGTLFGATGTISNCYAKGSVLALGIDWPFDFASGGGLVGWIGNGTVENCYSTGLVSGATAPAGVLGGLIGRNVGAVVTNSFWNTETSGQLVSAGGTGKTTAQMKIQSTYTGWDFIFIWSMEMINLEAIWSTLDPTLNSGYPGVLKVPKLYLAHSLSRAEL